MSVTVTLHIFSGRPDPTWELTDAQAKEFADRLAQINKRTMLKPPGVAGDLGYRGFSVESVREKILDPRLYLHAGIVDAERFEANRIADNADLEMWLLRTAGPAVDANLAKHVEGKLTGATNAAHPSRAALLDFGVPPFDPGKWNNNPNIQRNNNCYNYANDKITNTFAQPGRGSGTVYSALTCANVGDAAKRDGQVPVSSASSTPAQGHFIALVIWPGVDYHWYRLDSNAMWSHKPSQTPAKNTDHSGNPISDPQTCDRGDYTTWCGFYHCIPANTNIA